MSLTELEASPSPGIVQWVEESKVNQARIASQFDVSDSLDKDSLVQEIMGLSAYQSMPVSRIDEGKVRKHTRVNTASIDFYLSNPSSPDMIRKFRMEDGREPEAT